VRMGERIGDLQGDPYRQWWRKLAMFGQELTEGDAPDQLHDDECRTVGDTAGIKGGDDVGVRQTGRGDRLSPKSFQEQPVGRQVGMKNLDCDGARQHGVIALPYRRHATLRDLTNEAIAAAEKAVEVGWRARAGKSHGMEGYRPAWQTPVHQPGQTWAIRPLADRAVKLRVPASQLRSHPGRHGRRSPGRPTQPLVGGIRSPA